MWKDTIVSTWPFSTASAALRRQERHTGLVSISLTESPAPPPRLSLSEGEGKYGEPLEMPSDMSSTETGFQYVYHLLPNFRN